MSADGAYCGRNAPPKKLAVKRNKTRIAKCGTWTCKSVAGCASCPFQNFDGCTKTVAKSIKNRDSGLREAY